MPKAGMVSRTSEQRRCEKLKEELKAEGLGGVLIAPGPNMRYLTGVHSLLLERPFMLLVPASGEAQLVAPRLESGPYVGCPLPMKIHPWTDSEGPGAALSIAATSAGAEGEWGVEGRMPYGYLHMLTKRRPLRLETAEPILQGLREKKDKEEARRLEKSGVMLSAAFEKIPEFLSAGKTEIEVARRVSDAIYAEGATGVDDVLVQSGPRGADPHLLPSTRRIGREDSVVIDAGSTFEGYYADVTRTFCLGRGREQREVYETVLEAESTGIKASAEGATTGDVDRAARIVLVKAGLGKNFFHRTGHGLGLEIHEAPYIVEGGRERLRSGMCFTVEPGAYLRGKFGVRIEDDVLVRGGRGRAITDAPKEFGWWA